MMMLPSVTVMDGVKEILKKDPFQKYLQPNCAHEKRDLLFRSYTSTVWMSRDWFGPKVNPNVFAETESDDRVADVAEVREQFLKLNTLPAVHSVQVK